MELGPHIKAIPAFWKYIPFLGIDVATTLYPNIYLPRKVYEDLVSTHPSVKSRSILLHEQTHIERQKIHGIVSWNLSYLFNKSFRLKEELFAIGAQMKFLKDNGGTYDCHKKARQFSSSTYFWMMKYDDALALLEDLNDGKSPMI